MEITAWWVKTFYYLLDVSVVNRYILYKVTSNLDDRKASKCTHIQFGSPNQLIGDYKNRKQPSMKPEPMNKKWTVKSVNIMVIYFYEISKIDHHQPTKESCGRCAYCST